jgi:taurine dioxygenase
MSSPRHIWNKNLSCGAEVTGLTLATISEEELVEVKKHFADHGVVFFRGIDNGCLFTMDDHLKFAKRFGTINVNRFFNYVSSHPGIAKVEKVPGQKSAIGEYFHTDHSYDFAPALGSLLVARDLPATGGDTVFVDMAKAYDSLPQKIKEQLEGLRAVHSSRPVFGRRVIDKGTAKPLYNNPDAAMQTSIHPVVISHPLSKRKTLFVNPSFTLHFEGKTPEESKPLLETLYTAAVSPSNMTRFKWTKGSAILWDNRAVWHCAINDYHGQHRLMHRVTIDGEPLVAADSAGRGSEITKDPPTDVLALRYGEIMLELPYISLQLSTIRNGMANLQQKSADRIEPWWPDIRWYHVFSLRILSWLGIPARL